MNLRASAITAGVRGRDLAARFGVSHQTVSKWLRRVAPVPDGIKRDFAAAIGVTVEDLLPEPETTDDA